MPYNVDRLPDRQTDRHRLECHGPAAHASAVDPRLNDTGRGPLPRSSYPRSDPADKPALSAVSPPENKYAGRSGSSLLVLAIAGPKARENL